MLKLIAPLILASKSEIRTNILKSAGLEIQAIPAQIDERDAIDQKGGEAHFSPTDMALFLSQLKAESVSEANPMHLVIGCDQVLGFESQILHKAQNLEEAFDRLSILQGKTHHLHSGICVAYAGEVVWSHVETCNLSMIPLEKADILAYIDQAGEVILSSVGCYQLESVGVQLFSSIQGDYFSILGLPLLPLLAYLRDQEQEI